MIKKFAIFSILITLLCAPAIFADTPTYNVKITKDGFEPLQLIIEKGTQVVFKNEDTVSRWPASNVHPTHTIYPEFDPKKPVEPDESWQFQFRKSGRWAYHDHLLPHQRGEVVVKGDESFKEKLTNFLNWLFTQVTKLFSRPTQPSAANPDSFKKMQFGERLRILESLNKQSPKEAWNFLQKVYLGDEGARGPSHDLAHFVGGLIFEKDGFRGIATCTPTFAFGCYHGFLDKAFEKSLDRLSEAQKACQSLGNSGPVSSCIHGIGHGVASFYQTSDLSNALSACDKLTQGSNYCHDGVFMEFARNASKDFYKRQDPLFPCSSIDEKYVFSCGRNQPQVLIQRFQYSFDKVVTLCSQALNKNFKDACFDALGFYTVSVSNGNPEFIVRECMKISYEDGRLRCTKSAAGELIFQNVSGWQTLAPKICDSLQASDKKSCEEYIQGIIRDYQR